MIPTRLATGQLWHLLCLNASALTTALGNRQVYPSRVGRLYLWILLSLFSLSTADPVRLGLSGAVAADPDTNWIANAVLERPAAYTTPGLGAIQGVTVYQDNIYLYGDDYTVVPRIGKIREFDLQMQPTGRTLVLSRKGDPLLTHPTGLTFAADGTAFLGDTVNQKAVIFTFDWHQAWQDGNLDRAVRQRLEDDAAGNGCRPIFITYKGKPYLASADYGKESPAVRLYNIQALLVAGKSSAPGVVAYRFTCGPFNQNLAWDASTGQLTCIQNVVAGLGWQLEVIDLDAAVTAGTTAAAGVVVQRWTLPPHTELEGYTLLPVKDTGTTPESLWVTAYPTNNVWRGRLVPISPRETPAGYQWPTF